MPATTDRLNRLLETVGLPVLDLRQAATFEKYLQLIVRWNARTNLTAIREEDGILSRHFVESIACSHALPAGVNTLLDFGSGAGFPGIPIAICRPEVAVTLAESQGKKAAFLREAVRTLQLSALVVAARAETMEQQFDCVTMRAVDRMEQAICAATRLVLSRGWLALMTTERDMPALHHAAGSAFAWSAPVMLPGSEQRVLALGCKVEADEPPRLQRTKA